MNDPSSAAKGNVDEYVDVLVRSKFTDSLVANKLKQFHKTVLHVGQNFTLFSLINHLYIQVWYMLVARSMKKYVFSSTFYKLSFNTNISHHFKPAFLLLNTIVNSQLENTNSKDNFALKNWFKTFVLNIKDFWYTKINLTQICYD